MLSKLLFYKHIWCSSREIHLCTCSLRSKCRFDSLHYLILRLPARPFLRLVGKEDPPPVTSWCDQHSWHYTYCLFLFFSAFWHLWYFLSLDSQPCLFRGISRAPLISWGLHPIVSSPKLLEGAPKLLEEQDGAFHTTWSGGLCTNLLGGLCSCPRVPLYIWALLSCSVLGEWFLVILGSLLKGGPIFF